MTESQKRGSFYMPIKDFMDLLDSLIKEERQEVVEDQSAKKQTNSLDQEEEN